jgi:hypothetical protein
MMRLATDCTASHSGDILSAAVATTSPTPSLAVIVSYCSNEAAFIDELLTEAVKFCPSGVVVSSGNRLYSGEPEDLGELEALKVRHPQVTFVTYDVPDDLLQTPIALHNRARQTGLRAASHLMGHDFWVLLLDGDEVPDGTQFWQWWARMLGGAAPQLDPRMAYKMRCYWYFLSRRLVAETHEDSVLLVHAAALLQQGGNGIVALQHPRERDGICMVLGVQPMRMVGGGPHGATPMFHHYSWVREGGREALVRKVSSWGHRLDRPWVQLLHTALDDLEAGRWPANDFVHGYTLRLLAPGQVAGDLEP